MKRIVYGSVLMVSVAALVACTDFADARGRGGFRGGGGARGGYRGGGGRSYSRPTRSFNRQPSRNFSRPTHTPSFSQPRRSTGGLRPGSRPNTGYRRPGSFTRPTTRPSTRPGGNRTKINRNNIRRPANGNRVGAGNRTNFPGIGNRAPVQLPGLGGAGNRFPNAGNRVANRGDRVGQRHDIQQGRVANRGQYTQQRSQNLENRLQGRYDRQGQRQGAISGNQQNRRNDFQNWHNGYYHHYGNWHHGYWHGGYYGGWGNRWHYMWNTYPGLMAFNTTVWGISRIGYWSGYRPYSNSYSTGDTTIVNYSQPVMAEPPYEAPADGGTSQPATSSSGEPLPPGVSQKGTTAFEKAQEEFKAGNLPAALASTNAALKEMPRDAVINEFRALVLFAQGDYKHAAETLYAVLAVGPGWDWTTLSGLYGEIKSYTAQLRKLETYVESHDGDAAGHFVLGYHYVTCNHKEAAAGQFKAALKLNPNDAVSKQMLEMLGATPPPKTSSVPPKTGKKVPTIPIDSLVGTWNAKRGKSAFTLTLAKDKRFVWKYVEGGKKSELKGVFAVDGDEIAMEPDAGGVMVAKLKLQSKNALAFKMAGDEKDPGLNFRR